MKLSYILVVRLERRVLSTHRETLISVDIKDPGSNTNSSKNVTYQSFFSDVANSPKSNIEVLKIYGDKELLRSSAGASLCIVPWDH